MACDTIKIETLDADEVVSIVTAGPQGPSGSEAATLTTTGDMLYRAALANDRLPIGSEGQVLKVASGLPAWGNESGAVTEVNGQTGAVVLDAADVGASPVLVVNEFQTLQNDITLTSARYVQHRHSSYLSTDVNITLPTSQIENGDTVIISGSAFSTGKILIRKQNQGSPPFTVLAEIAGSNNKYTFRAFGTSSSSWDLLTVDTHTHAASAITSGTLAHERGGLEADVSAYNGLLKIASGSTSAVTVTAAGEALLDDADAAAQRTTLGLGNSATLDTGTTAGTVAEGNHTHTQLHDKSHSMTDVTSHTAGNHKVFYSNGSGEIVELALGNSGEVLTSNGATSAPSFAAASGGDTVSIDASAADVLTATSGAISADDGGTIDSADPFIKWDDTAGKLVYANPLSRPSGAFYVGLAPTTTALGSNAINIQAARTSGNQVAGGQNSVVVGNQLRCEGSASIGIGFGGSSQSNANCVGIGATHSCFAVGATAIGSGATANSVNSTAIGDSVSAAGRGAFGARPFASVYWGGQTTNDTPLILNLDATATNRMTIAANTALAVDILLVARRSDTADKWLVARRFLGIRRDGSNNTSLIGSVQTLGTDQTDGSPTWSFTLTADDTNEALQLEVTGAASETVQWRATAFYRVV